jgi:hypothetical protein
VESTPSPQAWLGPPSGRGGEGGREGPKEDAIQLFHDARAITSTTSAYKGGRGGRKEGGKAGGRERGEREGGRERGREGERNKRRA